MSEDYDWIGALWAARNVLHMTQAEFLQTTPAILAGLMREAAGKHKRKRAKKVAPDEMPGGGW